MSEIVSIYKDKFSENWIVDTDGTKEHPSARSYSRESFTTWTSAVAAAKCIVDSWAVQYPTWMERHYVPGPVRAHRKCLERLEK
jgi:hypothetical protein